MQSHAMMGHATPLALAVVVLMCALSSASVEASNTTTWRNFLGIFSCRDVAIAKPASVGDVVALVQSGQFSKIKAIGTGLSYNGWTCPAPVPMKGKNTKPRLIMDMTALDKIYGVDESSNTVLVDAGVRVGNLCRYLLQAGWALKTFSRQVNVTAAGALSTATHGSNTDDGAFSSTVLGVEIVFANGTVANITTKSCTNRGRALLPALRASMGRLGVITKVLISVKRDVPVRRELTNIPITTFIDQYTGSQAPPGLMQSPYDEQNFFYMPNLDRDSLVWARYTDEDTPAARSQVETYHAFYNTTRAATLLDFVPQDVKEVMLDPLRLQEVRLFNRTLMAQIWLQFLKEAVLDPPVTMRSVGFAAYWQVTAATRAVLPLSPLPNTWKLDIYEVAVQMSDSKGCLVALFDLIKSDQKYADALYAFIHIRFLKNKNPILLAPTLGKLAMYVDLDVYWYDGPQGVQYYLEWNRILDVLTGPQCNGVMHWGLNGPWKLYSKGVQKYMGKQLREFKAIADEVDSRKLFETELDQYFF